MKTLPKKRTHSARANVMVAVGSALYFLILLLALYVMDRQVYTSAKVEIIRNNFLEIFHPPDTLNDQARRAIYSLPEKRREGEREKLKASLQEIVDGPTSMYNMRLVDETGKVVVDASNDQKPLLLNTFENNLFIRSFSGRTSQNVSPLRTWPETTGTATGHLTGTYTSPQGVGEIQKLTHRYRVYAALFTLAWVLAWLIIYYYLLRPVRNVTLYLDRSRGGVPSLIPGARGALESGYNDLAASALLQLVEEKLNAAARPDEAGKRISRGQAVKDAMALAGEGFGAQRMRVGLVGTDDAKNPAAETHDWSADGSDVDGGFPALYCPANPDETSIEMHEDGGGFTWHAPLASGCLQVDCIYPDHRAPHKEMHNYLVRACDALRAGFVAFQTYQEQLFRERSEANISLSRNMGHDLTNIIATSKLELMGIKRILGGDQPVENLTGQRASILAQSVDGLLQSTRFMQEMVNIYRSFSYVKRPAYERRQLAPLIDEFLELFQPALSSHVQITRDLETGMPAPIVEPRLLKLALFNVLQNALDAIKRYAELEPGTGVIHVSVRHIADNGHYEIVVQDNGPGIRDIAGRMLSASEAQAIFDYGYSTKGETGEGLGLNWVQTIMTDFHDGGVKGENVADGGTRITLWLQSMERKEARVGNGGSSEQGSSAGFGGFE